MWILTPLRPSTFWRFERKRTAVRLRMPCFVTLLSPPTAMITLGRLVDKPLVLADQRAGAVRYRMLETVRQYAQELLTAPREALAVRRRHCAWCLQLAGSAAAALDGPHQ